jgi:enterochelin esterase-like enzyme
MPLDQERAGHEHQLAAARFGRRPRACLGWPVPDRAANPIGSDMTGALQWSLITGPVPVLVTIVGLAGLAALLYGRTRRWWTRQVPLVLACSALIVVAADTVVDRIWRPFPDPVPLLIVLWLAAATAAVGLAVARSVTTRRWRSSVGAAVAAMLVLVTVGAQANMYYGQYPTLHTALGLAPSNLGDFAQIARPTRDRVAAAAGKSLSDVWTAPPEMPSSGVVSPVSIPSPVSGFSARPGWVYFPPAYLVTPRAQLPVLVLVAGQPGTPSDWLNGGRLSSVMDDFATRHHGLAPVVVVADNLGSTLANPLCVDSRLGNAASYLTVDVPNWIRRELQIDPDPHAWAIGGFSSGGTCALQLAVRAPRIYPTFLDISGQDEPTLGSRQRTIDVAFGGDRASFTRSNPLDVLAHSRLTGTAGAIVAGRDDGVYLPQQHKVLAACRAAGMTVRWLELPGGHNWRVWGPGLEQSLPWLSARIRLIHPPAGG